MPRERSESAAWDRLERSIVRCTRCPRLVEHRRAVARTRRRAYRDQTYWGKPVPGFGDRKASLLLLGLAPAAHGANRTGRMFTGDRSGDWLYRGLHEVGLADRPESTSRDDGLELRGAFVSAACRCAPPANRPTRDELASCSRYLDREFALLPRLRVVIALGGIAWQTVLARARAIAPDRVPRPRPVFGHGARCRLPLREEGADLTVLGCYHPSQQNTFTGRLTRPMLRDVLRRGKRASAALEAEEE